MEELRLKRLTNSDIEPLTSIMKAAFDFDSQIHLGKNGGPTGYNDGSFLKKWALHPYATSYCVYADDILIGAFILWIHKNDENVLGCIFIDPKYENRGFGLRVWKKIESLYPSTKTWKTETPIFSHRNHHFYINKCGFHVVKIENPMDYSEGQFILVKYMKSLD